MPHILLPSRRLLTAYGAYRIRAPIGRHEDVPLKIRTMDLDTVSGEALEDLFLRMAEALEITGGDDRHLGLHRVKEFPARSIGRAMMGHLEDVRPDILPEQALFAGHLTIAGEEEAHVAVAETDDERVIIDIGKVAVFLERYEDIQLNIIVGRQAHIFTHRGVVSAIQGCATIAAVGAQVRGARVHARTLAAVERLADKSHLLEREIKAADMVGVRMRGDRIIKIVEAEPAEVIDDILPLVLIAAVDEDGAAGRRDDKDGIAMADIENMNREVAGTPEIRRRLAEPRLDRVELLPLLPLHVREIVIDWILVDHADSELIPLVAIHDELAIAGDKKQDSEDDADKDSGKAYGRAMPALSGASIYKRGRPRFRLPLFFPGPAHHITMRSTVRVLLNRSSRVELVELKRR